MPLSIDLPGDSREALGSAERALSTRAKPHFAASPAQPARASIAHKVGFFLFLLVNAALFIRPAEIFPQLEDWPIYEVLILASLFFSGPTLLRRLRPRSIVDRPIALCIIGLLPAVILSHWSHLRIGEGFGCGIEFSKIVLYYLLLAGLIDSPNRLRRFLIALTVFTTGVIVLAVLQYRGLIQIEALAPMLQKGETDQTTGERALYLRLQGTGIYGDPNDFCLIIVVAFITSVYGWVSSQSKVLKGMWIGLGGIMLYAFSCTQSRGGFIAFLSSSLVLFRARFGWKKTIVLSMFVLPLYFILFAGRQVRISSDEDSGQQRIQLWSDGLELFREAPLFGIGQKEYVERVSLVAHNSYIHSFTELGFFGGALFLGAFFLSFLLLHRCALADPRTLDPQLVQLRPYLLAIVTAYAVGLFFLSRVYVVPTYMILGLVSEFLTLSIKRPLSSFDRSQSRLFGRVLGFAVVFLIGLHVFVRVFANWD